MKLVVLLATFLAATASSAGAADYTTSCRLANGSWRKCPPPARWMTEQPQLLYDIDGQPRPFRALAGTFKGAWLPIVPKTCARNAEPDNGSDEFYARGCPPLYGTWVTEDGRRKLTRYGVIYPA